MKDIFRRKEFIISIFALILVLLTLSFLYLDFGIKTSETSINTKSEKFAGMNPQVDISDELYLYVEGGESMDEVLEKEIEDKLKESTNQLKSYANLKDNYDGPVLAVKILKNDIDYFPLYTTSDINAIVFFSSRGNTTYFKKFVREKLGGKDAIIQFKSSDGPHLIKKTELTVRDSSYGVFSINYYGRKLSEDIALKISEEMKNLN